MPTITFDGITKAFGSIEVIKKFTATVPDKEFLVLLGPSGCGKSTMLRMIAGLTDVTAGKLKFDESVVNDLSPKKRNIAFVFQSYALYPHMSVRSNIAFPLIMDSFRWWHHIPIVGGIARRSILKRPEVAEKVEEVAAMLELTEYADRKPKALSGGQRQRVALARSLIRDPSVYLLDEPLSNLDAKLRSQMRAELSALHARVQKTFIYVTHDQVEAMTMGTRIIVLNEGIVQQHGTPKDIYDQPANVFVAKFIGAPPMNLLDAETSTEGLRVGPVLLPQSEDVAAQFTSQRRQSVYVGIRAEKISVSTSDTRVDDDLDAHVVSVENLGAETIVGFKFGSPDDFQSALGEAAPDSYYARLPGDKSLAVGDMCRVKFQTAEAVWFDRESGERIDLVQQPVSDGPTV